MSSPDSDPTLADSTIDALSANAPKARPSPLGLAWLVAIASVAGSLAGVAAWLASEAILESYWAALKPTVRRDLDAADVRRFARALVMSASATFTALGALVGLSLGLAGGLARRSAAAGAKAALLGCVVGAGATAAVSLLAVPYFFKNHDPQSHDLTLPLLTLASIGSSIGAAGGLAFGIGIGGRDRWLKSLVGGLIGAALGTVIYEIVGAIAFPAARTHLPISETATTRAMLHILVAGYAGVGAAYALGLSSKKRAAGPAPS
jgi:hypothetical protein